MADLLKPYVLYVALYLGVALTGGSVVHLPLAPGRYLLIGCIGVIVFIVASVADARRRHATAVGGGECLARSLRRLERGALGRPRHAEWLDPALSRLPALRSRAPATRC